MAGHVTRAESDTVGRWVDDAFHPSPSGDCPSRFPVSFQYGGRALSSSLEDWQVAEQSTNRTECFVRETIALQDPETGLRCRCELKVYHDYPAVEWVAYLKNTGETDTPILSEIQALDELFPCESDDSVKVRHARGSLALDSDFEPLEKQLNLRDHGHEFRMEAQTGKSSTLHLPFFNLEVGEAGVIGAIGWTGGWAANFCRKKEGVHVQAGMERTHLKLHPGEEIRTPRILLLFWQGDRTRGHNLWRRLILAHYTPCPNGQLLVPPVCDSAWGERAAELQLSKIQWLVDNEMPVEYFWIDAGWYGNSTYDPDADTYGLGWAQQVGNFYPNPKVYPDGLGPIGEALKNAGLGMLLWVEPERAFEGTQMTQEHPEWLLGPAWCEPFEGNVYMYNLGIPEAREAMTEKMLHLFRESGVTCYRQDFNYRTVPEHWACTDTPDRIGMTEIRYIEGLYLFLDALLEGIPGLIIDNCAGGGQRLDLEMMTRSVPLWRSDLQCWPFDPISMQTQTQGLAPWIPLSGSVFLQPTRYAARSALSPGFVTQWSAQAIESGTDLVLDEIRDLMVEMIAMRKYFYGDFYPLVSYSLEPDSWAAWQYDLPEDGQGMVVAFRRHDSPFPCLEARLRGLDPTADYRVTSLDNAHVFRANGNALMSDGMSIEIGEKPGSALFEYTRLGDSAR